MNLNPMKNDAVYASATAHFGDLDKHLLAPAADGSQDDWPYRVILTLPSYDTSGSPELMATIGLVAQLADVHGWTFVPEVIDGMTAVRLTVTLPGTHTPHPLFEAMQSVVEMAHVARINIAVTGEPVRA